ncbi:MAG: class I SAM-dependent methyltransferase [Candidatus Woesearchaeota archaeon]
MDNLIKEIMEYLERGYDVPTIKKKLKVDDELIEIAKARINAKDKDYSVEIWSDLSGIRYSTHELVAKYRAERLKPEAIADVSCGIGIQLIHFAKFAKKAIGVDIDSKKIEYAKKNAESYGIKHITFIVGDSLSEEVINQIKVDIIFSDPARDEFAKERKLEDLKPNPILIYETYKKITDKFVFDLPPQIQREKIPWKGEFEYIELNGEINRLTFYSEKLAKAERSAVILPENLIITNHFKKSEVITTKEVMNYIYEVPVSVVYADLLQEFLGLFDKKLYLLSLEKKRTFLTSHEEVISNYFKNIYVLKYKAINDIGLLNKVLKENDYGKAIIKFNVDSSQYWKLRKSIEFGLKGNKVAYILKINDQYLICEKI